MGATKKREYEREEIGQGGSLSNVENNRDAPANRILDIQQWSHSSAVSKKGARPADATAASQQDNDARSEETASRRLRGNKLQFSDLGNSSETSSRLS